MLIGLFEFLNLSLKVDFLSEKYLIITVLGQYKNYLTENKQQRGGLPLQQNQNNNTVVNKDEVLKLLKELGDLKTAGILTEEEFTEKKKELLSKL